MPRTIHKANKWGEEWNPLHDKAPEGARAIRVHAWQWVSWLLHESAQGFFCGADGHPISDGNCETCRKARHTPWLQLYCCRDCRALKYWSEGGTDDRCCDACWNKPAAKARRYRRNRKQESQCVL